MDPIQVPTDAEAEFERKVWANFEGPDGRLKSLPAQQKKMLAILRRLALLFEPGERYPEKQVNEMLRRYHDDTATLRRGLIDWGLLSREAGVYWRASGPSVSDGGRSAARQPDGSAQSGG